MLTIYVGRFWFVIRYFSGLSKVIGIQYYLFRRIVMYIYIHIMLVNMKFDIETI